MKGWDDCIIRFNITLHYFELSNYENKCFYFLKFCSANPLNPLAVPILKKGLPLSWQWIIRLRTWAMICDMDIILESCT